MPTLEVEFCTPLHPGQREVKEHPARFKVLACGRRWGKTMLAGLVVVETALEGGAVWYVAPDFKRASRGWRQIRQLAVQIPAVKILEADRRIEFPGLSGGWLEAKSAHDKDALRGEGLDLIVPDEAAYMRESAWTAELRPALADRQGSALLISSFQGENYFYDLYQRGQDPAYPEWMSWRFPTLSNPHIDPEEVEEARRTTPKAEFEQEYEANPLVYAGAVFDGEKVQEAVDRGQSPSAGKYDPELPAEAGLDWGYTNETAFEVCQEDPEGRVVWVDERRWVATELNERCRRIAEMCSRYGVRQIAADAAGATEIRTLAETLKGAGLKTRVQPVAFGKYKQAAIDTRRWYLERGAESIGPACGKLAAETKRYRYKEGSEDVLKEEDHGVDAATAFYATRAGRLIRGAA